MKSRLNDDIIESRYMEFIESANDLSKSMNDRFDIEEFCQENSIDYESIKQHFGVEE